MNKDLLFRNIALSLQKFINFLREAKINEKNICDDHTKAIATILTHDIIRLISWDGTNEFPEFSRLMVVHNLLNALSYELEFI